MLSCKENKINDAQTPRKIDNDTKFINVTPIISRNKVTSFMLNSSTKIKVMGKYLNEKSHKIKQVMKNNAQQAPIGIFTNGLKSLSSYHLSTPQFINNVFVKSNSINLNDDLNIKSNKQKLNDKSTENLDLDLEPIVTLDDKFTPLSFDWWNKEFDYDKKMSFSQTKEEENGTNILKQEDLLEIDIRISSCNICEICKKFIYDEEIMSGWNLNDSDLNVKCTNCYSNLVPKLYIKLNDQETIRRYLSKNDSIENLQICKKGKKIILYVFWY